MRFDYDVIIAGGGPAGSSTANFLRQRGRSVLLLEKEKFPRFHIGESLLPFSNEIWSELGVLDDLKAHMMHKPGAHFVNEETGVEFTYYFKDAIRGDYPHAFQVKRAIFDKLLLDRARVVGAEVRESTRVRDVRIATNGVTVDFVGPSGSGSATAPLFVDASGRDALLARREDLKVPDELVTTNVAVFAQFEGVERAEGPDVGNIVIGLFPHGWWWNIHFADGDSSVGLVLEKEFTKGHRGGTPEEIMQSAISELPGLRRRLSHAKPRIAIGSEANWSYRSRRFCGDRRLLVGDAAAFVDPLFSTGVLFATQGAKFAAAHIDAALSDGDFSAARFAPYQEQCIAGMDVFKRLVHEFYSRAFRQVLVRPQGREGLVRIVTSLLAGDVYRPAMWHSLVKTPGFSETLAAGAPALFLG